jgi:hypothetical protein
VYRSRIIEPPTNSIRRRRRSRRPRAVVGEPHSNRCGTRASTAVFSHEALVRWTTNQRVEEEGIAARSTLYAQGAAIVSAVARCDGIFVVWGTVRDWAAVNSRDQIVGIAGRVEGRKRCKTGRGSCEGGGECGRGGGRCSDLSRRQFSQSRGSIDRHGGKCCRQDCSGGLETSVSRNAKRGIPLASLTLVMVPWDAVTVAVFFAVK